MDEVAEGPERLVEVDGGVGPVGLVQVDVVGVQPAQAVLDLLHDPPPRRTPLVGVVAHGRHELGGQHHAVAPPLERLADDLLGLARRVHVGRVNEVDARIEGGVDDADAVVVVAVAPCPEHHGSQAVPAHLDPGRAQGRALHQRIAPFTFISISWSMS